MKKPSETKRQVIQEADGVAKAVADMAAQVRKLVGDDLQNLAIVGVRTRGLPLAQRLRAAIEAESPVCPPLGVLDITLYRDDLSTLAQQPVVGRTDLPFDVDGRTIVLADDVIYTGRTVRAALEALVAFGRPKAVRLAVLVDRGHREYPIQPDIVGLRLETTLKQIVKVSFLETDGEDRVVLLTKPKEER